MDVPFMSCVPRRVQFGTEAIAPPGALILTPRAPSVLVLKQNGLKTNIFFCTLYLEVIHALKKPILSLGNIHKYNFTKSINLKKKHATK